MHRKIPLRILMQLKYGSQNLVLGKNRIRLTDKNINALETTMRRRRMVNETNSQIGWEEEYIGS